MYTTNNSDATDADFNIFHFQQQRREAEKISKKSSVLA
jgi:hypothetical protein